MTNSIINKAIILLMYSSSLSGVTIRNLKVKDLVYACRRNFLFYEDNNIENLLRKNPADIIPVWSEKSSGKLKITFSSPESLFYIFLHLKYRMNDGGLDEEDYLFVNSNGNPISKNDVTNIFNNSEKLNDVVIPKYVGGILIPPNLKFSSKDLKKNFIFVCENVLPDMKGKKSFIELLTKGVNENNTYYNEFLTNSDGLRYYYEEYILPYVTAKNFELQYDDSGLNVDELERNKCPDVFLTQIINNYSKNTFSDKFELRQNIASSREYFDKCFEFKKALESNDIFNLDNDDEVEKLKLYLEDKGLSELKIFLEMDNYEKYVSTSRSTTFKNDYFNVLHFERNMGFFIDLCVEYNDAMTFEVSDEFFDKIWVKADIQSLFEDYKRSFSRTISEDNIDQKMIHIAALLNEVNFFDRYDFEKYMYESNVNFNPVKQVYDELKEMLLKELNFREVSSIHIDLSNIVEMLQALDFRFK